MSEGFEIGNGKTMAMVTPADLKRTQRANEKAADKRIRAGMKPAEGFAYNPLCKFPPNLPCFCGSGKKSKKCCLHKVSRVMAAKDAEHVKARWQDILFGRLKIAEKTEGTA